MFAGRVSSRMELETICVYVGERDFRRIRPVRAALRETGLGLLRTVRMDSHTHRTLDRLEIVEVRPAATLVGGREGSDRAGEHGWLSAGFGDGSATWDFPGPSADMAARLSRRTVCKRKRRPLSCRWW